MIWGLLLITLLSLNFNTKNIRIIADATTSNQRAESIGSFRLWRDLGYAIGAIIYGITADIFGIEYATLLIGCITTLSPLIIKIRMPNN